MEKFTAWVSKFWNDEEGLQTLEMMLIIAVIVVIALAFREKMTSWVTSLLNFGDGKVTQFQGE